MDKYIIISDISKCPCYGNVNARLLYLHIACNVDTSTYNYCQSFRRLALETGLSVDAVRHAVKLLVRDGLLTTHVAPHVATQYAPQATPQATTHLHVVTIKDLTAPSAAPSITPSTTPSTTPYATDCTTEFKKLNNLNPTHAHACAKRDGLEKVLQHVLKLSAEDSAVLVTEFLERAELKGKAWKDEGDMAAHCVSFAEKRQPKRRSRKADDTLTRTEEYARTAEEAAQATAQERKQEEIERLQRWHNEAKKKGEQDRAALFAAELRKLQEQIN